MADSDATRLRRELVDGMRQLGVLRDERIAVAFLRVPREIFVPGLPLEHVYRDDAIVTKVEDGIGISSSSQPAIMALMLAQLAIEPGHRVLEIGAGTGYNAALLRELVGAGGMVVTIDIDAEVAGWARERLARAGYDDVRVKCADGADGWPDAAPYDRIELTVGADDIAPAWVEQLREGGVLVVPLWVGTGQLSIAFEKRGDVLESRSAEICGFIQMRGRLTGGTQPARVAPGVIATVADPDQRQLLAHLLETPPRMATWTTGIWDGFSILAGLWGLPLFSVYADSSAGTAFHGGGFGLLDDRAPSLAIVVAEPGRSTTTLYEYGGYTAAGWLRDAAARWDALGRPGPGRLSIRAYPREAAPPAAAGELVLATSSRQLFFSVH
jgi:protein-L-isoaspartate(D-aspartate) O-methyltransferase